MIDLKSISKSIPKVPRIVIHGLPGIGKTTFASQANKPIFILTEDGLGDITADHFPIARSFQDVMDALKVLGREEHPYKTVIIDSLDWLEPLVWKAVCNRCGVSSIEEVGKGYGKGYVEASTEWLEFFNIITALRDFKGMTVIMIAHSQITGVNDPTQPAYDTLSLKLNKRAAAMATEYADIVGYAALRMFVTTEEGKGFAEDRNRAITTGERVLFLSPSPAFTTKNRYHMKDSVPLSYDEFEKELPKEMRRVTECPT